MESFHVSDNQLSGTLPALDAMRHLQFFVIANNRFSGPLPPLTALTELKEFSVSANAFVGPVPAIAGLPLLHDFFLSDNALDGTMPSLAVCARAGEAASTAIERTSGNDGFLIGYPPARFSTSIFWRYDDASMRRSAALFGSRSMACLSSRIASSMILRS